MNEGNPTFPAAQTLGRDENLALGTTITTFAATDTDSAASGHGVNSYSFAGDSTSAEYFNIDNSAVITLARELDFETVQQHILKIVADDGTSTVGYCFAILTSLVYCSY